MTIQEYFDSIYCINLKSRKDRWNESILEFKNQQISPVSRLEAIEGIPTDLKDYGHMGLDNLSDPNHLKKLSGRIGCLLSHLEILRDARCRKFKSILILEDDVQFVTNVQKAFGRVVRQIPENWALLYFGGNEKGVQRQISENVLQVSKMIMTHAIGVNSSVYDELIQLISEYELPVDGILCSDAAEIPVLCISSVFGLAKSRME